MADGESAQRRYAVPAFLELIAAAFAGVAAEAFLSGETGRMIFASFLTVFFFVFGLIWPRLSPSLEGRFTQTATTVATDFRWWMVLIVGLFLYLSLPNLFSPRSAGQNPLVGDHQNAVEFSFPQGDLQTLSNDELRHASFALAALLTDLWNTGSEKHNRLEFGGDVPPAERADQILALEKSISDTFRSRFERDVLRDETELRRRLQLKAPEPFLRTGNISLSAISIASNDLESLARSLP